MPAGEIVVSIPIPVALAVPAAIVVLFALVRGILDILPL